MPIFGEEVLGGDAQRVAGAAAFEEVGGPSFSVLLPPDARVSET